ncbi:MAG: glycoside hydrolase family 3 C-terminal domain-containing protein [Candidatus Hydrogenedentes bacterium]|nr:glycoside hydrolase family 3 C-terminal domain-containing protein [Candidatus Hydrogenedentota bacterium]
MSRMTLEEKLAQLTGVWGYDLIEDRKFSEKKAITHISNGVGHISMLAGATDLTIKEYAETVIALQRYLVEHTRLGIPAVIHEECCAGFMARGAACFPQIIGLACTWMPELARSMAVSSRALMWMAGVQQALAPVLDVVRDPRWGRVEETFGEDPYLTACMGMAYIEGIQGCDSEGPEPTLMATGKHFVGYGVPEGGMNWAPSHIPERELREVFLYPFEAAVKNAGLKSIMPAYHELDGEPCHSARWLLNDILRKEWGFEGTIVSDYFGVEMLTEYHRIGKDKTDAARFALDAGVDVELPAAACYGPDLLRAVRDNRIDERLIDVSLSRVLRAKFEYGLFDRRFDLVSEAERFAQGEAHKEIAIDLASLSMVLLQNRDGALPLSADTKKIAVIGPNADNLRAHLGDYHYLPHVEITLGMMEGVNPGDLLPDGETVLEAIRKRAGDDTQITYAQGCNVNDDSTDGFDEAVRIAKESDVAILVMGGKSGLTMDCTCGEMRDRDDITLPGVQEQLVLAICDTGTPVVLVLLNGRPYALTSIAERVKAILETWLPGEQGGPAIAATLFGDNNPSGKLTMSFPRSVGQIPVYYNHKPSGARSQMYGEYVNQPTEPLFPFGHGLSYTKFEYGKPTLSASEIAPTGELNIEIAIKNTGDCTGSETVQLYINDIVASVTRPVKELKGFARVDLGPAKEKKVTFTLYAAQLAFYDRAMRYVVEPGEFEIMIGSSSEDIRRKAKFKVTGDTTEISKDRIVFGRATISE